MPTWKKTVYTRLILRLELVVSNEETTKNKILKIYKFWIYYFHILKLRIYLKEFFKLSYTAKSIWKNCLKKNKI